MKDPHTLSPLSGVTVYILWEGIRQDFQSNITDWQGVTTFSPPTGTTGVPKILRAVRGGRNFNKADFDPTSSTTVGSAGLLAAPLSNFVPLVRAASDVAQLQSGKD